VTVVARNNKYIGGIFHILYVCRRMLMAANGDNIAEHVENLTY